MAWIKELQGGKTETCITLYIDDLDSGYNSSIRTAYWWYARSDEDFPEGVNMLTDYYSSQTLDTLISDTSDQCMVFDNLEPGVTYKFLCIIDEVLGEDGYYRAVPLEEYITTTLGVAIPTVTATATQVHPYSIPQIELSLTFYDVNEGDGMYSVHLSKDSEDVGSPVLNEIIPVSSGGSIKIVIDCTDWGVGYYEITVVTYNNSDDTGAYNEETTYVVLQLPQPTVSATAQQIMPYSDKIVELSLTFYEVTLGDTKYTVEVFGQDGISDTITVVDGEYVSDKSVTLNFTCGFVGRYSLSIIVWNDSSDTYYEKNIDIIIGQSPEDITPTNVYLDTRGQGNLAFRWFDGYNAIGFNVKLIRKDGGYEANKTIIVEDKDENYQRYCSFSNLRYGESYMVYVQGYDNDRVSDWVECGPATTLPRPPSFSLENSSSAGYIIMDYTVNYTNATRLVFTASYNDYGDVTQEEVINVSPGYQKRSGAFIFKQRWGSKSYISCSVKGETQLNLSQPDCDNKTILTSSVSRSQKMYTDDLAPWKWISPMTESLLVDANKEVHPVTALEWNAFMDIINEFRRQFSYTYSEYASSYYFPYVYGDSTGHKNNPTTFSTTIYNRVANAIIGLSKYAGLAYDVHTIESGAELNATLFTNLSDQLNFLIGEL